MKNKRPLAAGFINQLDRWLLLNKPDTWSARTHLVLYYGLLFGAVLGLVYFFVPNDPRNDSNVYAWTFLTALLSVIGFIVWLIYLLRFNVFKRFGIVTRGDKLKTFLLYGVAIATLVAIVFIPSSIESAMANHAYGDDEIAQDVNTMNLAICRLNYDSIPRNWDGDTILVRNEIPRQSYNDSGEVMIQAHGKKYQVYDTAGLNRRKEYTDSIVTLNDSMYIFLDCPDYTFVNGNRAGIYSTAKELSSKEIYYRVFKQPGTVDKIKLQQELQVLLTKYRAAPPNYDYKVRPYANTEAEDADNPIARYKGHINAKYGLYTVNNSLSNITTRKYRWQAPFSKIYLRIFYYTTLILALLVFIFRQSTVKTFFLTLLAAIILLVLTSLIITVLHKREAGIWEWFIAYFVLCLVLAGLVNYTKTRNVITGIGLNLVVFFTVFMPLIVTALYYQLLKDAERRRIDVKYDFRLYKQEELHYLYAELLGFVLLLVLIEIMFKPLYRKWYALPEA